MCIDCDIPCELDFFERGFGLSKEHDPNEPVISYIYQYDTDEKLIVAINSSYEGDTSVKVKIIDKNGIMVALSQDKINHMAFQTWGNEKVIRVYLNNSFHDFLIYYDPKPRVIFQNN